MPKRATATTREVTVNADQRLYVIPAGSGYSCLGFDVLVERYERLAGQLFDPALGAKTWVSTLPQQFPPDAKGTTYGYDLYSALMDLAQRDGRRFTCELSPQLNGLEGHRVEVVTTDGETRRFICRQIYGMDTDPSRDPQARQLRRVWSRQRVPICAGSWEGALNGGNGLYRRPLAR